ncbi:MAG: glycosyl transferase family 2 [Chloroflexi bacterium]|nr:glycosyl transferase family 2 [Chloroflexota bacterium]
MTMTSWRESWALFSGRSDCDQYLGRPARLSGSTVTSISAVLPAFNEEELIGATAEAMAETLASLSDDYEVIVVNDGSRDRTREVVDALSATNSHVRCVSHAINRGYGDALKTGFSAAAKDLIFFTDGDRQFDVSEISRFIPEIDQADMVIGYRSPRRDPAIRLVYAWGWRLLVTILFGYTARDIDCAFKLFRKAVWQRVQVHSGVATFSAEFLVKARRCGFRIVELPVRHLPRTAGRPTGGNPRVILRAFRDIIKLRLRLDPCPQNIGAGPEHSKVNPVDHGHSRVS